MLRLLLQRGPSSTFFFLSCRRSFSLSPSPPSPSPSRSRSSSSADGDDDGWNDAWELAWLPDQLSAKNRAPWETDVAPLPPLNADPEATAFVQDMEEGWNERRNRPARSPPQTVQFDARKLDSGESGDSGIDEYRIKKQRIHAGLWMKEIEAMEEAKLGGSVDGAADIDRILDSCSDMFGSGNVNMSEDKFSKTSEFVRKPDGWEATSRPEDGNIWEVSQREEDILLQEFERRIAHSKFQLASFIKTHIFSRRRPIDGWKYMIEEIGPNARRGKGSAQRLPAVADPTLQPFREEKPAFSDHRLPAFKGR
ncbi:mucin-like protein [Wolffia australiana]